MHSALKLAVPVLVAVFSAQVAAQINLPFGSQKEVEKLSKSDISAALLLKNGDIDKCRSEHKKKEPKVSGKLVARFTVETSGKTSGITIVSTEFKTTTFATCLTGVIRDWTFPKAKEKSAPFDMPQTF